MKYIQLLEYVEGTELDKLRKSHFTKRDIEKLTEILEFNMSFRKNYTEDDVYGKLVKWAKEKDMLELDGKLKELGI